MRVLGILFLLIALLITFGPQSDHLHDRPMTADPGRGFTEPLLVARGKTVYVTEGERRAANGREILFFSSLLAGLLLLARWRQIEDDLVHVYQPPPRKPPLPTRPDAHEPVSDAHHGPRAPRTGNTRGHHAR